jgi:hypothetical protein
VKKAFFTLCAILTCCYSAAVAGEPVSVLNHSQAVPEAAVTTVVTPAPVVVVESAPVVVESRPAVIAVQQPSRNPCANGKCKLFSVDQQQNDFHRHRLFGGSVTRKGTRTVVKPVR